MFPNLKAIPVSKTAGRAVIESSVEFAGVDYQIAGIYLALSYPRHELVNLAFLTSYLYKRLRGEAKDNDLQCGM